ncbi:hypothetical protein HDU93_003691, partial [Gonapodya sp. JEL0774]
MSETVMGRQSLPDEDDTSAVRAALSQALTELASLRVELQMERKAREAAERGLELVGHVALELLQRMAALESSLKRTTEKQRDEEAAAVLEAMEAMQEDRWGHRRRISCNAEQSETDASDT